jgi:hypothetical protein
MSRIASPKRGSKAAKRVDLTDLREALMDRRLHAALGVVVVPPGASSHWSFHGDKEDVIVEVETMPEGLDLSCRLGTFAGGPSAGLWRVPAVGDEVAVLLPNGQMDFMPTIVAVLSTGQVPARVGTARTVLVAPDEVEIEGGGTRLRVKAGVIQLGDAAAQAVVRGTAYRQKEALLFAAIKTFADGVTGSTTASQIAALGAALSAAVTAFEATASSYLSTVSKTE